MGLVHRQGPERIADRTLEQKIESLRTDLASMGRVVVAFSGGVDSTYLLEVAHEVVPQGALALTTVSPTNPEEDTGDALAFARDLGIEHVVIEANELEIPGYRENPVNRCYFCKSSLYTFARREADVRGIEWIVDGVNLDDLGDHRPGLDAAAERGIRHPLADAGLTKDEIRTASRELGLATWDRPSSPCLSSRFPYGTEITLEGLERVARSERAIRGLGFPTCRVRLHGDVARIEIPPDDLTRAIAVSAEIVEAVRATGFRFVALDLEGFRSGSLNRVLEG